MTPRSPLVDSALTGRVHPRAGSAIGRLQRKAGRFPLLFDVTLAVVVALVSVVPDIVEPHGSGPAWAFDLFLLAPLAARRRWPAAVFLVISAVARAQWVAGVAAQGTWRF